MHFPIIITGALFQAAYLASASAIPTPQDLAARRVVADFPLDCQPACQNVITVWRNLGSAIACNDPSAAPYHAARGDCFSCVDPLGYNFAPDPQSTIFDLAWGACPQ
jgi:hypothetical protein